VPGKLVSAPQDWHSMLVSCDHAGGSIVVVEATATELRLQLRPDPVSKNEGDKIFHQHFDFIVSLPDGAADIVHITIENAGTGMCSYEGYQAMYCLDNMEWQRAEGTAVVAESLVIPLPCLTVSGQRARSAHVAYFVPFNYETRHTELIARCLQSPHCTQKCAALSVQQREVSLLSITDHSSQGEENGDLDSMPAAPR